MQDMKSFAVAKFEGRATRVARAKANGQWPSLPKNPWTTSTPMLDHGKTVMVKGVPTPPTYNGGLGYEPDLSRATWGVPYNVWYTYILQRVRMADPCGQGIDTYVPSQYNGNTWSPAVHGNGSMVYWMTWNFTVDHVDSTFKWEEPFGFYGSDGRPAYSSVGFTESDIAENLDKAMPAASESHQYTDISAPAGAYFPTCKDILDAQEKEWDYFESRQQAIMGMFPYTVDASPDGPTDTGQIMTAAEFNKEYSGQSSSTSNPVEVGRYPTGKGAVEFNWAGATKFVARKYFYEKFVVYKVEYETYSLGDQVAEDTDEVVYFPKRGGGETTSAGEAGSSYVGMVWSTSAYQTITVQSYAQTGPYTITLYLSVGTASIGASRVVPEGEARYKVMYGTEAEYYIEVVNEDWKVSSLIAEPLYMDYYDGFGNLLARRDIKPPDFLMTPTPPELSPYPKTGMTSYDFVDAYLAWTWITLSPLDDLKFQEWVQQKAQEWGSQADQLFQVMRNATIQWVDYTQEYLSNWYDSNVQMRQQWYDQAIGSYVLTVWNIEHPGEPFDLAVWTAEHPSGPFPTSEIVQQWLDRESSSEEVVEMSSLRIALVAKGPKGSGSSARYNGSSGATATRLTVPFYTPEPPPTNDDPSLPPVDPTDPYDPRSPVYDPTLPPKLMEFNPPPFPYSAFQFPPSVSPGGNCQF